MKVSIEMAGDVDLEDFGRFLFELHSFLMKAERRCLIKDITID
jgi:hypothetical protein